MDKDENATKTDPVDEPVEKKKKDKKDKKKKDDKKDDTAEPEQVEEDDEKKEKKKKKKEKKEKKDKAEKGDEEEVAEGSDEKKEKKKKKKEKKEKKQQEEEDEKPDDETKADETNADNATDQPNDKQVVLKGDQPQDQTEDCDFLIIDFCQAKNIKKIVWTVESSMEKIISDIMRVEVQPIQTQDKLVKQVDLKNVVGHQPFEYEFMLKQIADQISEPQTKTAFKLIEPKCARTATKSSWVNFGKQAESMDRDPNHVLGFFKFELGCNGTIGTDNMLILNGGYQQKHFLKIIRKYVDIYVKCDVCNGYDSTIEKDMKARLEWLKCMCCGASRTVPTITKTFEAKRRGERRRGRQ